MFLENHNSEEYKVKSGKIKEILSFKITCFLKKIFEGPALWYKLTSDFSSSFLGLLMQL